MRLKLLIVRFLRAGVAFGAVKEVGPDGYALAPSYAQLADPKVAAALPKLYAPKLLRLVPPVM